MAHRIFQRGDRGGGAHRAGIAHHEQITETAIEQQLHRHPGVGTTEHGCQGMLACHHRLHPFAGAVGMQRLTGQEALMALLQPAQHRRRTGLRRERSHRIAGFTHQGCAAVAWMGTILKCSAPISSAMAGREPG